MAIHNHSPDNEKGSSFFPMLLVSNKKVYTFMYNSVPVTIYCDGKPHEYPEFVAKHIDAKLQKVSESNTYKEIIEERLD